MNKLIIGFGLIFILIITTIMLTKFFDIGEQYYMPYVGWGVALCIFYMVLDEEHVNIFMPTNN